MSKKIGGGINSTFSTRSERDAGIDICLSVRITMPLPFCLSIIIFTLNTFSNYAGSPDIVNVIPPGETAKPNSCKRIIVCLNVSSAG